MSLLLHSENVAPFRQGSGDSDERATVANFEPSQTHGAWRGDDRRGGGKPRTIDTAGAADAKAGWQRRRHRAGSWQRGSQPEAQDIAGGPRASTDAVPRQYDGFNDQHFTEKLVEVEGLELTRETVR